MECIVSDAGIGILNGVYKKKESPLITFIGPYGFQLCQEATGKWNICDAGSAYYTADGLLGDTTPPTESWKVVGNGKDPAPKVTCTNQAAQPVINEANADDGAESEEDYESGTEEYWEHYMSQYCHLNDMDAVKKCIDDGCPVNIEDPQTHETPLRIACDEGHYDLAEYLLDNGADIDPSPGIDYNCLQVAVMKKRDKIVKLLLSQITDKNIVNRADPDGDYPVHACAMRNLLDILKILVEEGNANLTVKNAHQVTPLHLACQSPSSYQMAHYILSRLNKNTYAINAQDDQGDTPLHYAARSDCDSIIILLNDNDADADIRNYANKTPYELAQENGYRRSMDILAQSSFFNETANTPTTPSAPGISQSEFQELPTNVFDYQGVQWGYYLTANHPRAPSEFYAQPQGEEQWYTYKTLTDNNGKQYYQCVETNAYSFSDPRCSDYFACPITTYQVQPPAEPQSPTKNKNDDAKMKKKIQRLQTEVERYKKAIQEAQRKHEEELERLEEKQTDELRNRDETISKYFTELNVLKVNTIKPEREKELQEEIEKLKSENEKSKTEFANVQKDVNVRNLKIKKMMKDAETAKEKYKAEKDELKKEFEEEKKKLMKDFEDKCALISKQDTNKEEISKALETAAIEKQQALDELSKKHTVELNKYKLQIKKLNDQIKQLNAQIEKLNNDLKDSQGNIDEKIEEIKKQTIIQQNSAMESRLKEMEELYIKEHELRKKLHNEIIELKGNIRVFCRSRPLSKSEMGRGQSAASFPKDDTEKIIINKADFLYTFEFDAVFPPESTQEQVFEQVSPFITSALDGYNICIFAYGQTGSGKTFTMQGPDDNPGVNFKALNLLFETIHNDQNNEYKLSVSVLEIYNETINDLLKGQRGTDGAGGLQIRQGPDGNFVEGLLKKEVNTYVEVIGILKKSQDNRSVGCHNLNEHSSRSHLIVTIYIEGFNNHSKQKIRSVINMVDLAGSERAGKTGATGDRLKEAQAINKSLSALGDVMKALGAKDKHIPYRNVKLTHLLQDSLSKHSKVLMFVNISPSPYNVSETLSSLQFAERCRNIELGRAVKNVS